jgi:hypothetical protein
MRRHCDRLAAILLAHRSASRLGGEKASEKLSGFYERWSVKFTAQYYEAKAREKAAKACSDRI